MDCNIARQVKFIYIAPFKHKAVQSPFEYGKKRSSILSLGSNMRKELKVKDFKTLLKDGAAQKLQRSGQHTDNKKEETRRNVGEGGRKKVKQGKMEFRKRGWGAFTKKRHKKGTYMGKK